MVQIKHFATLNQYNNLIVAQSISDIFVQYLLLQVVYFQ